MNHTHEFARKMIMTMAIEADLPESAAIISALGEPAAATIAVSFGHWPREKRDRFVSMLASFSVEQLTHIHSRLKKAPNKQSMVYADSILETCPSFEAVQDLLASIQYCEGGSRTASSLLKIAGES